MKNKQALLVANESYQEDIKSEVDHAQKEVMRVLRNALVAGGLAVTASLLQKAFFNDESQVQYKPIKTNDDFLTNELTEKATVEALKFAAKRLEEFLEEVNK